MSKLRRFPRVEICGAPSTAVGAPPQVHQEDPREPDAQAAHGRDPVSPHRRLRRDGRSATRKRPAVASTTSSSSPARPGQDAGCCEAWSRCSTRDPVMPGCEINARPSQSDLRRLPGPHRRGGGRHADRLAAARPPLRREAGDARRHHRRHGRRHRSDQGGQGRAAAVERADDALRAAAAGQPRHLRDQRAARPRRQDPGRPVQHPPGGRRPDQGLPDPAAARSADGVHRQPGGLHRPRQDHHPAQGPHRLGDPHALPGQPRRAMPSPRGGWLRGRGGRKRSCGLCRRVVEE